MKKIYAASISLACIFLVSSRSLGQQTIPVIKMDTRLNDNTPRIIKFDPSAKISLTEAEETLNSYLPVDKASDKMILKGTTRTKQLIVQRYAQLYKGIPVEHGSYVVVAKDNNISMLTGKFYKTAAISNTTPSLSEAAALTAALSEINADKYSWQLHASESSIKKQPLPFKETFDYPKGTIVYTEDFSSGKGDGMLHLAYKFQIYALKPLSNQDVFVDAVTGKILLKNSRLCKITATGASLYSGNVSFETEQLGSDYYLYDLTRGGGIYTVSAEGTIPFNFNDAFDITNPTTTWPASAGIDAHWASEKIYDYWLTQQGRDSYDGMGSTLYNLVNYDLGYDNAFWNGYYMTYGDGSGIVNGGFSSMVSLDICAHELGHGVCQTTCDLMYMGESGAMNEGLSDIWGSVIENWANPNETDAVAKSTWEMGEEVGEDPLRSMADPKLYGNPDTYGGTNWTNTIGCSPSGGNDECGVHNNSGIMNHWFYLVSQGGNGVNDNGHSYEVPGIGISDAAVIAYNTEALLFSTAQYADAALISIAVADQLFGSCSLQKEAVSRAWDAVGVDSSFTPCTPQISFSSSITNVTEKVAGTACPASKIIDIPVEINGPLLTGDTATITVTATSTNATAGVDYNFPNTTLNFLPGINTTQHATLTIFDNGAVDADKEIVLHLSLAANGSNATLANVYTQNKVIIINDDKAPDMGGMEAFTVGVSNATSNLSSPFQSSGAISRSQFIIPVQELLAAGVRPNIPIQSIAFKVVQKVSTIPFNDYTIRMSNTSATDASNNWVGGLAQVYNGNYSTVMGWNVLNFSNNFSWNGTSNIAVEVCFSNTTAGIGNDRTEGVTVGNNFSAFNTSVFSGQGCLLPHDINSLSSAKPVMRFEQNVPSSAVETVMASNRSWDVHTGQDVYYYSSADNELIARLKDASGDLGCVTAEVAAQGNGFVPATFGSMNRSVKEIKIEPAQAAANTNYEATLYFRNTELANANLANVRILKTNAATDASINAGNTVAVVPTVVNAVSFTGFKGDFTGFSRFFLIDNDLVLSVKDLNGGGNIGIASNPFHDQIKVNYTVRKNVSAAIRLFDITGKMVYNGQKSLSVAEHSFVIDVSGMNLAAGNYMLQIVTSGNVLNEKMLKN